ncbi:Sulfotransferase family protein [Thioclava dalianensis]|uniref:sulfotransferase family protein n=1 Tax=Thioclava dalianensis TaxID=1185766 RepID=UPI0008F62FC3|nr:sulfotransferase [Thioclava dalianensis]SFN59291.1 Sulfotransferase family protein [Thioclava dalianensis]
MTDLSLCRSPSGLVLPDLVICGVPKAGTSSLFDWLAAHPDVEATREKEARFFVDRGSHMYRAECHVSGGLAGYARLFAPRPSGAPDPVLRCEATPGYIYARTALAEIPDLPNAPRCLFVLREPSAQILSLFRYFQGNWDWIAPDLSFADYVAALSSGRADFRGNELAARALEHARYIDYLRPWQARLGAERMRVVLFDQLAADPRRLMRDLAIWLGLDPEFYGEAHFAPRNQSYRPRSRLVHAANLRLRGRLPQGRFYRGMRRIYRRLNTAPPPGLSARDRQALAGLRQSFAPANRALAQSFDLDLDGWA